MMSNNHCLWVQALQEKYCQGKNLLQARGSSGASWVWQSIMQSQNLVAAGFCWRIGGGADINIWCDPWVPGLPGFIPSLKVGAVVDRRVNYVCDLIQEIVPC